MPLSINSFVINEDIRMPSYFFLVIKLNDLRNIAILYATVNKF